MKNSSHKEDRKKYVFFTDPDVVAKRAEISAVVSTILIFVVFAKNVSDCKYATFYI